MQFEVKHQMISNTLNLVKIICVGFKCDHFCIAIMVK